MAGRYESGREWDWRSEDREPGSQGARWAGREDRSFRPDDRVFGERDSGMGYNQSREEWRRRGYGGASSAMPRGEYDAGYRANPGARRADDLPGGRYYGDDGRETRYGEAYGPHRPAHEGARRFGSREADERYARAIHQPYEEAETFEDRARDAGGMLRRTGERIAGWFSDVAGDLRQEVGDRGDGRRSARGLGPKGYRRSDERISEDVHERLTEDHWLDASDVIVAVSDGEVTLSGVVDSRETRRLAERIVEDLSGVRHVQNNLRIRDAGSYTPAGSGSGGLGNGGFGAGVSDGALREEGDGANTTSANARNKT